MKDQNCSLPVQFDLHVGIGRDGGTAILSRHVAWPWSLPRGFRLNGRDGPLTILPQAAGAALLPGDDWRHRVTMEAGHLHLITAGAGLAHAGDHPARVDWQVSIASGTMAMLPDPWVLSCGADMHQSQQIDLGPTADFVLMDGFCLRNGPAEWRSETVILRNRRLLLRDDQRACPQQLGQIGSLPGGMCAFGQIILAMDTARLGIPHGALQGDGVYAAAAPLREGAGTIVRLAATSGGALSAALDGWRTRLQRDL